MSTSAPNRWHYAGVRVSPSRCGLVGYYRWTSEKRSNASESIKPDLTGSFERVLSASNMMLPLLAEVNPIDHAVDRIVAEIRLEVLDEWLKLGSRHRSGLQQEQDRVDEE